MKFREKDIDILVVITLVLIGALLLATYGSHSNPIILYLGIALISSAIAYIIALCVLVSLLSLLFGVMFYEIKGRGKDN